MSLDIMEARINAIGGITSDGRINKGKLQSLRSAMKNSYQAEYITYNNTNYRCLINHVKISTDYDQKELSIEKTAGIKPGEVFYWNRESSYWMVLNQRTTEEAYFRGEIRQCSHIINTDTNEYHVWLQGPTNQNESWIKNHNINFNDLNYRIYLYIQKNEDTNKYFTRNKKVKFDGHNWIVSAVDRYSQSNILEVSLEEYNDNEMEDKKIEPEISPIDITEPCINGPQVVYPYDCDLIYEANLMNGGSWNCDSKKIQIKESDELSCTIDVITGRSGEFTLQYIIDNEVVKELKVIIDSL